MSDLVERLRNVAAAYPEEFFPPFTQEELDEHSVIISQASGCMGRFLSKHMQEAAAEIERLRAENERLQWSLDVETQAGHPVHARLAEAVEVLRRVLEWAEAVAGDTRFVAEAEEEIASVEAARAFLAKMDDRTLVDTVSSAVFHGDNSDEIALVGKSKEVRS